MKKVLYCSSSLMITALILALVTGCKTSINSEVTDHRTDPLLVNGVLVGAALPLYLIGVRTPEGSSVLKTGTPEEIRRSAVAAAQADIAAGKPRIAFTGGIASTAVGVPPEHLALVEKLPKVPLPAGCTVPSLQQAMIYAEAYNKEILPYVISKYELHK